MFSGSDTDNRRGVFLLARNTDIPVLQVSSPVLLSSSFPLQEKCTAFACAIRSPEHQAFLLGQSCACLAVLSSFFAFLLLIDAREIDILNISAHPNLVRPVHCYIEKSFIWYATLIPSVALRNSFPLPLCTLFNDITPQGGMRRRDARLACVHRGECEWPSARGDHRRNQL